MDSTLNGSSSVLPTSADIVVAGGGPAGATIACLLAPLGFRVVLLDKRHFPRHQIGESLTPQILPILDFLGLRTRVEEAGFLRTAGHTVCWGTPQPRTSYYSPDYTRRGFQAWRADFDHLLLTHARHRGVQVYEGGAVESVDLDGSSGVRVRYARQGHIEASFFVDASGHAGILARRGFRQRDKVFQTLAITGYWRGAGGPTGVDFANTLLETYADGMIWSVPLHNGLRNVTLLVDWQAGSRIRHTGLLSFYLAELQKAPYLSDLLAGARLACPPRTFDATLYTASSFAGERFLLVGDAGLFIDPLSSEGVHKAMASAITGAAVVNTILRRPTMIRPAVAFYEEGQRATYQTHYHQSVRYYREEPRWPDHPFWRQRSQTASDTPPSAAAPSDPSSSHPPHAATSAPRRVSHLRIAPGVTVEQRPVIEGPYIELREAVIAPAYPRGVRFLQGVCVPTLLRVVAAQCAVADVMTGYVRHAEGKPCPPEAVRQALARLYQEGVLVAAEPAEA